jgi:septum formation protein
MLTLLSGRSHDVLTAIALVSGGDERTHLERTRVWFGPLSAADIEAYVETGEPLDKAGAYAIQGLASRMIPRIEGSYTNVVGLPVEAVWRLLRDAGLESAAAVF